MAGVNSPKLAQLSWSKCWEPHRSIFDRQLLPTRHLRRNDFLGMSPCCGTICRDVTMRPYYWCDIYLKKKRTVLAFLPSLALPSRPLENRLSRTPQMSLYWACRLCKGFSDVFGRFWPSKWEIEAGKMHSKVHMKNCEAKDLRFVNSEDMTNDSVFPDLNIWPIK